MISAMRKQKWKVNLGLNPLTSRIALLIIYHIKLIYFSVPHFPLFQETRRCEENMKNLNFGPKIKIPKFYDEDRQ